MNKYLQSLCKLAKYKSHKSCDGDKEFKYFNNVFKEFKVEFY